MNPLGTFDESDEFELAYPTQLAPGILVGVAKKSSRQEILQIQASGASRVWTVRAIIGTAVPLSGSAAWAAQLEGDSNFVLNEDPLSIYLHSGGHNAVYYDLRGSDSKMLTHIDVQVESELPSNAMLLARRPVNALLDVLTRNSKLPLLIQRLELLSPSNGKVLIYEFLFPQGHQIAMGPLGGIQQAVPFAPYDAIYREALTSSSPFYRLLCGARIFEGAGSVRKWIKEECDRRNVKARMPKIPDVDTDFVRGLGVPEVLLKNVSNAQQLYENFSDMRNAIAHFLFKQGDATGHVYLADGANLRAYSAAAAALLHYAHQMLEELRVFYVKHLPMLGSHILPMPSYRERFIVKARDYGLK
ncbi:MAG: methylamine utilization protein MauJ [Terracidiphilus sp.]